MMRLFSFLQQLSFYTEQLTLRDGPLENLWGGGGGQSTKKIFAQGKIK